MHLRALLAKSDELLSQLPPSSHNDVSTIHCPTYSTTSVYELVAIASSHCLPLCSSNWMFINMVVLGNLVFSDGFLNC